MPCVSFNRQPLFGKPLLKRYVPFPADLRPCIDSAIRLPQQPGTLGPESETGGGGGECGRLHGRFAGGETDGTVLAENSEAVDSAWVADLISTSAACWEGR